MRNMVKKTITRLLCFLNHMFFIVNSSYKSLKPPTTTQDCHHTIYLGVYRSQNNMNRIIKSDTLAFNLRKYSIAILNIEELLSYVYYEIAHSWGDSFQITFGRWIGLDPYALCSLFHQSACAKQAAWDCLTWQVWGLFAIHLQNTRDAYIRVIRSYTGVLAKL